MPLCAFPYLDNEAMSYLKSLGWIEGQKKGEVLQRARKKSQCLPLAPGSLSSLTVSCNINMSEQRSRAYHAACNNRRRLGLARGGGEHSENIPPSHPVA